MLTRLLRPAGVLLALALPLAAADMNLMRLARPDVNLLLGLRVADISTSPLVKTMLDQATAGASPQVSSLLGALGPHPLASFEEILVAANVDAQSPQEPKDTLVLVRGALDLQKLAAVFCAEGCDRESYRGFELIKVEREDADTPGYLVLLDSQYAALGERPAVAAAIDRSLQSAPAGFSPRMQGWVDRLSRYHFWLAATGPFETSPAGDAEPGPAALASSAAAKMEGFGFGLLLDSDVSFTVELESISDADSQQLFQTLQGFLALARMGQQQEPQPDPAAFDFFEHLELLQAGRVISASLSIPQTELTEQLRAKFEERQTQLAAVEGLPGAEASQAAEAQPQRSQPRPQGAIRVFGLESQPVEYPVTPK